MCGIFGFVGPKYDNSEMDLQKMKLSLAHRGPDCSDFFSINLSKNFDLNLGHVRLAILDTSTAGNQPMKSKSGRFTIVFNGEIYNFKSLKIECEKYNDKIQWVGHSDTEIILECFEQFGIIDSIQKFVGMFAISIWDKLQNKLYLIRDRIGEKPLFYGYQNDQLIFASELKAFEINSKFVKKVNMEAAIGFLYNSYVPNNLSIYSDIYKVKPGSILEFDLSTISFKKAPNEIIYWSLSDKVKNAKHNIFKGTYDNAKEELENLLINSVKEQSISDVPFGAFLSGGIDSSLVCALIKNHVKSDLMTFTIGMPEPGVNEAIHAEKVANSIGTIHKTKYLNTDEILSNIEEIISFWDEPFADSSQIPTYFVSKYAKNDVTVSLSGDGADEFLYGYNDHRVYSKYKKYKFLGLIKFDQFLLITLGLLNKKNTRFYNKLKSLSYLFRLFNKNNDIEYLHYNWKNKFWDIKIPVNKAITQSIQDYKMAKSNGFENVGHYDALTYLPNDILVKVDRASMSVSLETRAPFLDHRVLEFLITLPKDYLFFKGVSKRIAKDILYKYVPKHIVDRPKQGFSIPVSFWLKNDLKNWANTIIDEIPENSIFWDKNQIDKIWYEHQQSICDHPEKIWNILVLELFFKRKKLMDHDIK